MFRDVAAADREAKRHQKDDRAHFDCRQHVLDEASRTQTAHVDRGQHRNRGQRDDGPRRHAEREHGHREDRTHVGHCGNEAADVISERDGAGRDRAGETGDERRPSRQERGERTERLAQVDILAPGTGPQRGELGVRHRAGERQGPADQPHTNHRHRLRDELRDEDGNEEDAAAYDVRDDDRGCIERAEAPLERGSDTGRSRCCGRGQDAPL